MYIDQIQIENFRTFRKQKEPITFCHPEKDWQAMGFPKAPAMPNVNLILGNNGAGKTTLLKAIALACMGPAVGDFGIFPYRLIRREPYKLEADGKEKTDTSSEPAKLSAQLTIHPQDGAKPTAKLQSKVAVVQRGDAERLEWQGESGHAWDPIYSEDTWSFFFVGYGAVRRVENRQGYDAGSRKKRAFTRALRVMGLFEEEFSLVPLNSWLPALFQNNPGRYVQVIHLMGRIMKGDHYQFTGAQDSSGDYVFEKNGLHVPYSALSDGYRSFFGWLGDLIYHVCMTTPKGKKLVDNKGIVMVDEIDLYLHPKWQMTVLQTLAKELPNIQFIVTSHSPLIVGSLEWMNIIAMQPGTKQSSKAVRIESAVHGLDADQVLLTDFFGLESTRAAGKSRQLKNLTLRARDGDAEAAKKILAEMSGGTEVVK
jgi:predicted ATP-binding protein involved in virulence